MKNIRDTFDTCTPDSAQIGRMAQRIEEQASAPLQRTYRPLKRVCVLTAAALLLGVGTISAAAYVNPEIGEAVMRIFTREEELIDPHAVLIGAQDTRETASLTVEKAVRDGDTTYLYCTITRADGVFDGHIFTAEHLSLMQTVTETNQAGRAVSRTYPVRNRGMGEAGILAGDILKVLPEEPADSVRLILPLKLGEDTSGEYTLTLTEPFTTVSLPDGTFPRTVIADELSVTFTLGEIEEEMEVYEETPMTEIELGGGTVTLERVRISPVEVTVEISDPEGEMVPVPGHPELEVPVIDYLRCFITLHECRTGGWETITREEHAALNDYAYQIEIRLRDGVTTVDDANSYGRLGHAADDCVTEYFRLNDPIYPEDVEKIVLYCYSTGDEIVIWESTK